MCISVYINSNSDCHLFNLINQSLQNKKDDCMLLIGYLTNTKSQSRNCTWSILGDLNLPDVIYSSPVKCCKNDIYSVMFDFLSYNMSLLISPEPVV